MAEAISEPSDALDRAIKEAGGVTALATKIDVSQSLPSMWKKRGRVPAEYCPDIEEATGVSCEELRPDVNWGKVRDRRSRGERAA